MTQQFFLSFAALKKNCIFIIPPRPCSAIYLHSLVMLVFFLLYLLPSVSRVSTMFSKPFSPRNLNCLFLILSKNVQFVSIFIVIAHTFDPCHSYHPYVEPHFCGFKHIKNVQCGIIPRMAQDRFQTGIEANYSSCPFDYFLFEDVFSRSLW